MPNSFNIINNDLYDFSYSDEKEFIEKRPVLSHVDQNIVKVATVLKHLNSCITLHDKQNIIMKTIFVDGKLVVFVECGRKFGKTELMMYFFGRIAAMIPNAAVYYIAPFMKQAGEILWHPRRLQDFFSPQMKDAYGIVDRNSDYRIIFKKTGSFIKLDGADNHQAYRGVNPHGVGYEEFKDHHLLFHEGMEPNLATFQAPLMIIGTPPESEDNQFCELADYAKEADDEAWFNFPTWDNPHISKEFLLKTKKKLFKQGKQDVWFREYCAKRVKSGRKHIFGLFDESKHVKPFKTMMDIIQRTRRDWEFFVTADPASSSVFAMLFTAIHKYKKTVFHLDEIYQDIPAKMATRPMIIEMIPITKEVHEWFEDWNYTYDEAAKWFSTEVLDNFGTMYPDICFNPTEKHLSKKDFGIGLINEQIGDNNFYMSDRCVKFKFEVNNYIKDAKGKVPTVNDHLIDCARYTNHAAGYATPDKNRPHEPDQDELKRGHDFISDKMDDMSLNDYEEKIKHYAGDFY